MFNLNFKEVVGNAVKDTATDLLQDGVDELVGRNDEVFDLEEEIPLIDDPYISEHVVPDNTSLRQVKAKSEELIQGVNAKNIFSLPSIITVLFFLLSTVYIDIDSALEDGKFTTREWFKVFYLAFGGVATLVARYNDPSGHEIYTPHFVVGKDKEDFIDRNKDGIDDRYA